MFRQDRGTRYGGREVGQVWYRTNAIGTSLSKHNAIHSCTATTVRGKFNDVTVVSCMTTGFASFRGGVQHLGGAVSKNKQTLWGIHPCIIMCSLQLFFYLPGKLHRRTLLRLWPLDTQSSRHRCRLVLEQLTQVPLCYLQQQSRGVPVKTEARTHTHAYTKARLKFGSYHDKEYQRKKRAKMSTSYVRDVHTCETNTTATTEMCRHQNERA